MGIREYLKLGDIENISKYVVAAKAVLEENSGAGTRTRKGNKLKIHD